MAETNKPILALTMGDPAGVGPEVIARAWGDPQVHDRVRAVVVGHPDVMLRAAKLVGRDIAIVRLNGPEHWSPSVGRFAGDADHQCVRR